VGEFEGGNSVVTAEEFLKALGLYEEVFPRSVAAGMSLEDYVMLVINTALEEDKKRRGVHNGDGN